MGWGGFHEPDGSSGIFLIVGISEFVWGSPPLPAGKIIGAINEASPGLGGVFDGAND